MDFLDKLSKIEPLSNEEREQLLIEILSMLTTVMRSTSTDLMNSVRAADLLFKLYGIGNNKDVGLSLPKLIEAASGQLSWE